MPFLKEQIKIVNDALRAGSLSDARFSNGLFEEIAIDVSRMNEEKVETFPAIMDNNYEAREISVNDTYPIIIYHKIIRKGYAIAPNNFGDGNKSMIEKTDVKMVVYGKYASLKITAEQLEAVIAMGFPDNVAKAKLTALKLDSMSVNLIGSNMNSAVVFQEEYKGFDLFLSAEDIFFSMNYSIESKFRKGCFSINDCGSSAT